jgi:hypothetical protein
MNDYYPPSAAVLLDVIKLRDTLGQMGEDFFGELEFGYRTSRWDENLRDWEKVPDGFFFVSLNCSDAFFWGSSDEEEITEETWPILLQTIEDLRPIYAEAQRLDDESRERSNQANHESYVKYEADHPDKEDREWWDEQGNPRQYVPAWRQPENRNELWTGRANAMSAAFGELFAARVRGVRPQGASYSLYPRATWPLFDACGPKRETGLGNPYEPGEYQGGPRW